MQPPPPRILPPSVGPPVFPDDTSSPWIKDGWCHPGDDWPIFAAPFQKGLTYAARMKFEGEENEEMHRVYMFVRETHGAVVKALWPACCSSPSAD